MCKYNENIYKEVEMIKSNQTGITEFKVQYMKWTNSLEVFNTRFERTKEKKKNISELENWVIEIIQEEQEEKWTKGKE